MNKSIDLELIALRPSLDNYYYNINIEQVICFKSRFSYIA